MKVFLSEHDVMMVQERGWSSIQNGELLGLASTEFQVLVADQNIPHQQNLSKFDVAVVVLVAQSNRIEAYEPLADQLRQAILRATPGSTTLVTA